MLYPTVAGWLYLGLAVLVGAAAGRSESPLMLVLFGMMVGSIMASVTIAHRMVSAVGLRRDVPDRAWQFQTVHLGYYLRNRRGRGPCLALALSELGAAGIDSVRAYCVHLRARGVFRAGGRLTPRRRGRAQLSSVEVSTVFPFGLIRAARRMDAAASLVVWPARGRLTKRLLHRGAARTSTAPPSPASGGQDEFFGLRDYRSGDNPRWIHWRRSAGRTTPVLREMARPLPDELWLVVDAGQAADADRERALRFAATLVDHALSQGYRVALAMAGPDGAISLPAAPGRGQRRALLDALAGAGASELPIEQVLDHAGTRRFSQAQVILITTGPAELSPSTAASLRRACRHLRVVDITRSEDIFEDHPAASEVV